MDERSIPIIILVVNLLFGLAILAVPSFLLFGSLWSILSMIAIIVVEVSFLKMERK